MRKLLKKLKNTPLQLIKLAVTEGGVFQQIVFFSAHLTP
jgi:hypothetical protein